MLAHVSKIDQKQERNDCDPKIILFVIVTRNALAFAISLGV